MATASNRYEVVDLATPIKRIAAVIAAIFQCGTKAADVAVVMKAAGFRLLFLISANTGNYLLWRRIVDNVEC